MRLKFFKSAWLFVACTLCTVCHTAELGEGDALSAQSAVKVISAESEDDLYQSVLYWIQQRHPDQSGLMREFRYLAADRALFVQQTTSKAGERRSFYFETPGLPFQFVGKKK
jgi:hypothetical protein